MLVHCVVFIADLTSRTAGLIYKNNYILVWLRVFFTVSAFMKRISEPDFSSLVIEKE